MKKISSVLLLLVVFAVSTFAQNGGTLDAKAFDEKIKTTKNPYVMDVRTPGEFSGGHIENAVNINYNSPTFKSDLEKLDKNAVYFVYCLSGGRSSAAANYMRTNGFKNVYDLKGGVMNWQNNHLPLATEAKSPSSKDKISYEEYEKMIKSEKYVLIDYYAPWCEPCKKMEPMLNEIAEEYKGKVKVIRLNIAENKELAKKLAVEGIPILKIFKNGKEVWVHNGAVEKTELVKHLPGK